MEEEKTRPEEAIRENLAAVHKKICAAAERAGRNPKEVTLIAVSKTKPLPMLLEAYQAGQRVFGENKVQEICEKFPLMPQDAIWHMIGHLQTNKVRSVIGKAAMIHSVDSTRLAVEIQKEAEKRSLICDILIEVNIAKESSKYGIFPEAVPEFAEAVSKLSNVRLRGLMTVAPYTKDPEENRKYFRQMKKLSVDINQKNVDNNGMDILSMGMTGDYEVAVEEGATMVRVGTGIFGERSYGIKQA